MEILNICIYIPVGNLQIQKYKCAVKRYFLVPLKGRKGKHLNIEFFQSRCAADIRKINGKRTLYNLAAKLSNQ